MSSHTRKGEPPYSVHSKNRDTPTAQRIRERADQLDLLLNSERRQEVVGSVGLAGERGPYRLPGAPPSPGAWALGVTLAYESIEPLRRAFARYGTPSFDGWSSHAPQRLSSETATLGLPLLGTCSDEAVYAASRLLTASRLDRLVQVKDSNRVRLARFLSWEHLLWDLASEQGGPSARIPYAFAFYGLEWFWNPKVHKVDRAPVPCLRCGRLMLPAKRRTISAPPRCARCSKEPPAARQGPENAIAPAGQGKWWIRCQGCDQPFEARADAHSCSDTCRQRAHRQGR